MLRESVYYVTNLPLQEVEVDVAFRRHNDKMLYHVNIHYYLRIFYIDSVQMEKWLYALFIYISICML